MNKSSQPELKQKYTEKQNSADPLYHNANVNTRRQNKSSVKESWLKRRLKIKVETEKVNMIKNISTDNIIELNELIFLKQNTSGKKLIPP